MPNRVIGVMEDAIIYSRKKKKKQYPDPNRQRVAYGYARVSTDRQDLSMDAQEYRINQYFEQQAMKKGFMFGGHYLDPDISSHIPFRNRPAGHALTARLLPGDLIMVSRIDRAFRSPADGAKCIELWGDMSISLVAVDTGITTGDYIGDFQALNLINVGYLERGMISMRTKDALAEKRRNGLKIGPDAPLGTKHEGSRVVANPEWFEEMEELAKLRDVEHKSWVSIGWILTKRRCDKQGIKFVKSEFFKERVPPRTVRRNYDHYKKMLAEQAREAEVVAT